MFRIMERILNRILGLTLLLAALQGCTHYDKTNIRNDVEAAKYDPASTARIRVFSSPEVTGSYQANASCEQYRPFYTKEGSPLTVSFRDRRSTKQYILWRNVDLLGMVEEDYINRTIDIPASQTTEALKHDRLGYNEYVIPAGKPTVMDLGFHAVYEHGSSRCSPKPVVLVPEAGKDYEVRFATEEINWLTNGCRITVSELSGTAPLKTMQPVKTSMCVLGDGYTFKTVNP